jgi:hypothetical protein
MKLTRFLLVLSLFGLSLAASAQSVRYDAPATSTPGATVQVCSSPANGVPCSNYVTTFDSNGNACPNSAQDTPQPSGSACQANPDNQGHIGFWLSAGQFDYTICQPNAGCSGPITITLGTAGTGAITSVTAGHDLNGGGSSGNITLNVNTTLATGDMAVTQLAGDTSADIATDAFVAAALSASGLLPQSGCGVESIAGTLQVTVGACYNYTIGGKQYSSPLTTVTLAAADPTNPRLDLIGVNSSGAVFVTTGTPAAQPVAPTADPTSQLGLTTALIPANATSPTLTVVDIYHENAQSPTEWNTTSLGAPINLASTNNPYRGTKDIEATAATTGNYAQMTDPSAGTVQMQNYNNLVFYLRPKAAWAATRSLSVQWLNGGTATGNAVLILPTGTFGFTSSNLIYQQIAIPTSAFGINGVAVTSVRFTVSGSGATIGFYLDDITLQGGQNGNPPGVFESWLGTWASTTGYNPNNEVFYLGTSWIALSANTNSAPTLANTNWAPKVNIGTNQQVIFNAAGVLSGNAGMLFNSSTHALTLTGPVTASQFNGTGAGAFTLSGVEGAAASGVALSDILWADSTTHRWKFNPNNAGAFYVPGVGTAGTSAHCVQFATNGIDLADSGGSCGGTSYTLQIAGSSLTSGDTVNFNATTPTAPTNGYNVTFATSKASTTDSVSAALVGDGNALHCYLGNGTLAACPGGTYQPSILPLPPALGSFTWVNQSSFAATATASNNGNSILMTIPYATSLTWRLLEETAPATPYSVAFYINTAQEYASSSTMGVYFYDGTKLEGLEFLAQGGPSYGPRVERITNVNADGITVYGVNNVFAATGMEWPMPNRGGTYVRLRNSGTNIYFDYSLDGSNWINVYSEAVGAFITPTAIGFGGLCFYSGAVPQQISLQGWLITNSATL